MTLVVWVKIAVLIAYDNVVDPRLTRAVIPP